MVMKPNASRALYRRDLASRSRSPAVVVIYGIVRLPSKLAWLIVVVAPYYTHQVIELPEIELFTEFWCFCFFKNTSKSEIAAGVTPWIRAA